MAEASEVALSESRHHEVAIVTLSPDDLPKLLNELSDIADKWEEVATYLNMRNSIVDVSSMPIDVRKKLFEIMKRWLNETHPAPTVNALVAALRAPFIGENWIANKIEAAFTPSLKLSLPPQKSNSASATNQSVAHYESNCSRSDSSPAKLSGIANLKLVTSFTSYDQSTSLACESFLDEHDGDDQCAFQCPCDKNCSLSDILNGKCSSTSRSFPQLTGKGLSEGERDLLCRQLYLKFFEISKSYASLTSSVRLSLKERKITAEMLTEKLMDLEGFVPLRKGNEQYLFENRVVELSKAETIEKIFLILKEYHSFFNHEIIDYIVGQLGTEQDRKNLEKYNEEFTEYCKHSIFECPFLSCPKKLSKSVELVMKVSDSDMIKPYTVQAVKLLQAQVAKVLQLTTPALTLVSAEDGCLQLTFQIPHFLQTSVFPLHRDQRKGLTELGVVKLDCDGICQPLMVAKHEKARTRYGRQSAMPSTHAPTRTSSERGKKCLNFLLLGQCTSGSECKFQHTGRCTNTVEEYVSFPADRPQDFRAPIGRKGYCNIGSTMKGYIVVISDRDPTREVKIVAEDEDTVEYARKIIFSQGKARLPLGEQVCVKLKLLGHCGSDLCPFKHTGVVSVENPKRDYIPHPAGKSVLLRKCIDRVGYTTNKECYLTLQSDRHPDKEVLVYAENDDALEYAKSQLPIMMGRAYTDKFLNFCYVHPEGVEELNITMKFERRVTDHHHEDYQIIRTDAAPSEIEIGEPSSYKVEVFDSLNPRGLPTITKLLDAPAREVTAMDDVRLSCRQTRVLRRYKEDVSNKLREGLQWMLDNNLRPKLEGRLGKIYFNRLVDDIRDSPGFNMYRIINFLLKHKGYKRFFKASVAMKAQDILEKSLLKKAGSTTITYDMKLNVKEKGKLDIRLRFADGKPEVVRVKKDERKVLMFDVLCLNREHDMRVSLNAIDICSPRDSTVQNFLANVTMPAEGVVSFVPLGPDEEWTVRMLRHKVRKAYFINDSVSGNVQSDRETPSNYLVTICEVHQYEIKKEDLKSCDTIEVGPKNSKVHTEVELHNLKWDVSIGHQLGLTPEQSLSLLLEPDKIPHHLLSTLPDTTSNWSPDMIMKDFEGDDFFQMMYNLNKAIG